MSSDSAGLIKEHLDIASFVGRYTKLERKGNKLSGLCPIHKEKSPSFYVDPQKGVFHCFGCGRGGDVIHFCMELENLQFVDALEYLADIAGVELPKRGGSGPGRATIDALRQLNEDVAEFYHQQLFRSEPALAYFKRRGISETTIRLFKLGYADNQWDALYLRVAERYDPKLLQESGLFRTGSRGFYDTFRERVIFPIRDVFSHVVAFGGRIIEEREGAPKYINSPETPIYTKGKHLFNLNFAKPFLKKEQAVVVVEGYMDAIQVYQAGVGAVIASLGTAFTSDQARLLKRHAKTVVLNFDGDQAGFKAARTSIETCLRVNLEVQVAQLPGSKDPDEFIKSKGVEAYRGCIDQARDFFGFLLEFLAAGGDPLNEPHLRSAIVQEMVHTLACIEDPVVRSFYEEKLAEGMQMPLTVVRQVAERMQSAKPLPSPGARRKPAAPKSAPSKLVENTAPHSDGWEPPEDFLIPSDSWPDEDPFNTAPSIPAQATRPESVQSYRPNQRFARGSGKGRKGRWDQPPPPNTVDILPGRVTKRAADGTGSRGERFTLVEQKILYQIFHHPDYTKELDAHSRELLPRILQSLFSDTPWLINLISGSEYDFQSALHQVPSEFRGDLTQIFFNDHLHIEEGGSVQRLFIDLVKQMKDKVIERNRLMLSRVGDEQRRQLMRLNAELNKQYHMLVNHLDESE